MVERKDSEMKRLAQEVHDLSEKNTKLSTEKLDLQRRVNELDTSSMQAQFEVTRLSREKQHLEQQFQWASGELDVKAKEVADARKEKSSQVMALRMQLDEVLEARRLADEQVTTLRARCTELERQKGAVRACFRFGLLVSPLIVMFVFSRVHLGVGQTERSSRRAVAAGGAIPSRAWGQG